MSMDKDSARQLLNDTHEFPGKFDFRVVTTPPHKDEVIAAFKRAAGDRITVNEVVERASKTGKFVRLLVKTKVHDADTVLDVWAVLHKMDEVLTTL